MKNKDQTLLESLYSKSVLKENDHYVNLNGDVVKKQPEHKITLGGKVNLNGDVVPDEYNKRDDKDVSDLIQRISDVLNDHDTSEDIAKAIAQVIKNEYQSDYIIPFKQKLNEYLPDPVNEK
jgi:hypothetical protein